MRIHCDNLTYQHVSTAASSAGVCVEEVSSHGSRKRDHAFEVKLSGSSPYAAQGGQWKAATWDEWGNFLAALFDAEPSMIAGPYKGRNDFLDQTQAAIEANERYESLTGRKRPGHTAPWLKA